MEYDQQEESGLTPPTVGLRVNDMKRTAPSVGITWLLGVMCLPPSVPSGGRLLLAEDQESAFRQAKTNGRLAAEAFSRSRRFLDGWLKHADPETGLIPRGLSPGQRDFWNVKDAAADNYPFMVITAAMTERPLFDGRMLEMLRTEKRLTSRVGRMPDDWSFEKGEFRHARPDLERIIFGSSEYMKDGLLAISEWLGPCPWTDRLVEILDDLWAHAPVETPQGKIPSTDTEVNGEMLQVLSRMYWLTGERKYLDFAVRLGDYYLVGNHHPTRDLDRLRLIAHGGEIVSGLCELYVTVHFAAPEKKKAYRTPLYEMLDRILEVGRNEHGMIYVSINPRTGEHDQRICDTWGYTYNGYYSVYLIDGTETYRQAVLKALGSMKEHYTAYDWERGSADGYADSIESALNLYNREAVPSAAEWIDSEIRFMFEKQRPDGVIEGWHGDGNSARTWLLYALWKTRGLTVRPWRSDVRFGAVERDGTLYISLAAERPWTGRLVFDKPRHRANMHLPLDYPRLNQFPEWFAPAADSGYRVRPAAIPSWRSHAGRELHAGLSVALDSGEELRLVVAPASREAPSHPDPKELVMVVADAVLRDFPRPPPFNWGEGVLMTGMMRAYRLTRDERYLKFVGRFADHWHRQGIRPILEKRGYCGHWGPGFPLLLLYETTMNKRYLAMAEEINQFMLHRAERTRDGGLSHFNGKPQLWVDTLDMCCPVLSNLARITNRPALQREAVRQLEIFAKHLQDPETGLFYHMWDEGGDERTPSFWGRGNGWVVMSSTEVLKNETSDSPARSRLLETFKKQLSSIVRLQDTETGLWRTVLDAPDSYLETSASAMFLYGMAECRTRKIFDVPYEDALRAAWSGLSTRVDANGRIIGVSAGTGPSGKAGYVARPVRTYTWGTGAFLLAACAYAEGRD